MVEYCPLRLLFEAAVSIAGVFQVNHCQHSTRQSGKGHTHPIYLVESYYVLGLFRYTRIRVTDVSLAGT